MSLRLVGRVFHSCTKRYIQRRVNSTDATQSVFIVLSGYAMPILLIANWEDQIGDKLSPL